MAYDAGLTEEEWAKFRRESTQALPAALGGMDLPDILMPSQKRLLEATASSQMVVSDKSRRIGFTWAVSADAVLTAGATKAAGGMDVFYIGYNLEMAREFIDTCAMWAKAFMPACTAVGEVIFTDSIGGEPDKHIQAFRIAFASGFEIVALSSRPRSLRGRQGYVILDEFAFHDGPDELLKAAMALLIWGGKVLVISTHNGVDNPFNKLLEEIRAGKRPGEIVRCTFDQALDEGLYQRICLIKGETWTPEAEAKFRAGIRANYGAGAAEELDCIPSQGTGVYLTRALIEAAAIEDGPVLRLHCPVGFELKSAMEREAYVEAWLEQNVLPELKKLDPRLRHYFGSDFARSGDVSGMAPGFVDRTLRLRSPFVIEMRNVPHEQQRQVFFYTIDRLPRFTAGKMDARGNGSYLAEVVMQEYGASRIEGVMPSQPWYLDNMPKLKAAYEDRTFSHVRHVDIVDDVRQIQLVRGVPMVPPDVKTKGSDGLNRHGDFGVAFCMLHAASRSEASEYAYHAVRKGRAVSAADDDFDNRYGGAFADRGGASVAAQLRDRSAF
jgi:phage FluMu gp28-like protein